jgi:hypothetical protein
MSISYRKAVEMLRLPGTRMIEQHDRSKRGKSYYVIPHGPVDDDDAMKIMSRADAYVFDDGLFKAQSWKIR